MNIGGLRLSFGDDEDPKVIAGKKHVPHRIDLIKQKLKEQDIHALDLMFFNFNVPDVRNDSTIEEIEEEGKLFSKYADLLLETAGIKVPENKTLAWEILKNEFENFYRIEQKFNGCRFFGIGENTGDFHETDSYCN